MLGKMTKMSYYTRNHSLIHESNVVGKMDFGYERTVNTSDLQTGFVNKWRRLFYRKPSSISEMIEVRKSLSSNGIFKIDLYRQDLQRTKL